MRLPSLPSSPRSPPAGGGQGASPRARRQSTSSLHHTPRSPATMAESRKADLDRILDVCKASVSQEMLLSEQLAKETAQARDRLKQVQAQLSKHHPLAAAGPDPLTKSRNKLLKRASEFEARLSEATQYNGRLADAINALRKQMMPHRQCMKRAAATVDRRQAEMQQLKQATGKALDERERFKTQLRLLREERAQERQHFATAVANVERKIERLDEDLADKTEQLDSLNETSKKSQFLAMKSRRAQRESLDVKYGYLRSTAAAIDDQFRELERIVGVLLVPGDRHSLELIINQYLEREAQIASLQQFWQRQSAEAEAARAEITALERDAGKLAASEAVGVAVADAAAVGRGTRRQADEAYTGKEAGAKERLASVCRVVGHLFQWLECEDSAGLSAQGCSATTVEGCLSAIEARLDEVELTVLELYHSRSAMSAFAARPHNEVLDTFAAARLKTSLSCPASTRSALDRRNLPSVADQALLTRLHWALHIGCHGALPCRMETEMRA
mmetsp:Transcript_35430/g.105924  ORF Transcript_35430/g.105924 Transcript_35430/m.105924 type:complete len:504 (-) Transcript_35430:283-1794(-)